jgi:hypothetical protein
VDGCQGQGILEESSSGSRGLYWTVVLTVIMMMNMHLSVYDGRVFIKCHVGAGVSSDHSDDRALFQVHLHISNSFPSVSGPSAHCSITFHSQTDLSVSLMFTHIRVRAFRVVSICVPCLGDTKCVQKDLIEVNITKWYRLSVT